MDPSWFEAMNEDGMNEAANDDLMQYLNMGEGREELDYDELDFSEETASVKSEHSEMPSPFDPRQASPWGEPEDPRDVQSMLAHVSQGSQLGANGVGANGVGAPVGTGPGASQAFSLGMGLESQPAAGQVNRQASLANPETAAGAAPSTATSAAAWEASKDFNFDFRRSQVMLQDMSFGRTDRNPAATTPPPVTEDFAPIIARGVGSHSGYKYNLHLGELPMRSRVETQIKCTLTLSPPPDEHLIHLPSDTIARPRFQLRDDYVPHPSVLSLEVDAVVPSDPSKPVYMCSKCIAREKKRAFRKKTLDMNEEYHWNENRPRRLIILNCREILQLPMPKRSELVTEESVMGRQVELPLRLACYCRHHAAKLGYQLIFSVRDYQNNVVARAVSDNIFITDNHKEPRSGASTIPGSIKSPHVLSDISVGSFSGASSFDDSSDHSSASERSSRSGYHPYSRRDDSQWHSRRTSSVSGPSGNAGMYKGIPVPAPSPGGRGLGGPLGPGRMAGSAMGSQQQQQPQQQPQISNVVVQRAIPAQGSVRGGVEVTLLGQGFYKGLTAMFGDTPAISTQCWSDNTMISHLPPSSTAGPVIVSFQGLEPHPQSAVFTYVNDSEVKLVELALQVVGFKMNGKIEDATDVANRIVNNEYNGNKGLDGSTGGPVGNVDAGVEQVVLNCLEFVRVTPGERIANLNLRNAEGQTMMHLASILGFSKVVVALLGQGANIDMQDVSGMTPLHFATLFGNRAITRQLLQGHADPFHRHFGGKTALEIADTTVTDLLPKNQRSYYQQLNTQNSSSTLASVFSRDNMQPLFSDLATSQLPSPLTGSDEEDNGSDLDDDESILATVRRLREDQKTGEPQDPTYYRDAVKFISRVLGLNRKGDGSRSSSRLATRASSRPGSQPASLPGSQPGSRPPSRPGSRSGLPLAAAVAAAARSATRIEPPPEYNDLYPSRPGIRRSGGSKLKLSSGISAHPRRVIEVSVSESSADEDEDEGEDSGDAATDEQLLANWEHGPMKEIRNDQMLFTFWIPLLVIALSYVASLFVNFGGEASAKLTAAGEHVNSYFPRYAILRDLGARRRT